MPIIPKKFNFGYSEVCFGPVWAFWAQKRAKQKILPLELPIMMPKTSNKIPELTLGSLQAGMTMARTEGNKIHIEI